MAEEKLNIKKLASSKKSIYMIDPKDIYIDPEWNERNMSSPDTLKHIDDLAYSFSKVGIKDPVTVVSRDNQAALTDGYCRMAAIKVAAEKYDTVIKAVPVRIEERGTNEADHIAGMITRNSGRDLNTGEQAGVVKRLLVLGLTKDEIADKIGKTLTHVDNCMLLLEADPTILAYVRDGEVSSRFVLETVKAKGDKALPVITKAIATAKGKGKTKATKRDAPKTAPKIQWGTHGPECVSLLEALDRAYDELNECPDSIADVVNSWREYKDASNLEVKSAGA